MRKFLLAMLMLLCSAGLMMAQRTVSGTVTDTEGEPLIGVSVVVKGTTTGTVTDIDGEYSLELPDELVTLVYSYVGLQTVEMEVPVAQTVVDVEMSESAEILQEVIVTALGITRDEKAVGYSVERVDGESLQQIAEPDPLRALQGKVAGVNISSTSGAPGSSTRFTIRGNSSLLGNNDPLIVVDGIPYDNSEYRTYNQLANGGAYGSRLSDLDPNNIEEVTILKGASAAALYGSRAANGVVLITTKTGKDYGDRPDGIHSITLRSSVAFEEIANLPDYQNTYGTGTNFSYSQVNGSWGAPFVGTRPYANRDSIPHWYQGRLGFERFDGVNVPYRAYPDNVENLFRTGNLIENSLSITGSTGNTSLSGTFSYTEHEGYVPETDFSRFTINVGGNTQFESGFKMGATLGFTASDQEGVLSGVGSLGGNNPSAFARALYMGRNWDVHGQPFQNPIDLGSEFMVGRGQADNPLWSYENAGIESSTERINASFSIGYEFNENLSLDYVMGVDAYSLRNKDFLRPGSTGPSSNPGVGRITEDDIAFQQLDANLTLSYDKYLTDDLSLRAIVGTNVNQRKTDRQAYQGLNYVIFDIDDIDNTNNVVPFGGDFQERRIMGVFGDVSFGYKNWAYLTLTARNDWSSTLPKDNRSYLYPAVTGSVILTEALEMDNSVFDFLKLRAGWSQVGNDTDPYQLAPVYLINSVFSTNPQPTADLPFQQSGAPQSIPGLTLSDIERDPDLLPEQTTEFEIGTEMRLLKNRVGLNFTYYNRTSEDLIAPVSLPTSSGFSQFFTNFGELSNEGFEVALDVTPIRLSSGFEWNIRGVFTTNDNTVESLREGVDEIEIEPGSSFAGAVIGVLRPGEPYGVLRGSVNLRDDNGNLLIDRSNGQLIRAPLPDIIGDPNPDFTLGLVNTFKYKGLSLRAVWDWTEGGDLFSNTVLSMMGRGVTEDTENREIMMVIPGVYGDGNTGEPILDENGNTIPNQTMVEVNTLFFGETFAINAANEWSVFDATVYRLREVSLGYQLPARWFENFPVSGVNVSVSGRNLWYHAPGFPEHTNYDPEINQFGATNKQGIEYSATPTTRRYAFNLMVNF